MVKEIKKRRIGIFAVAMTLLCVAVLFCVVGCTGTKTYTATGIEWINRPKTLYKVGDSFDVADSSLQITYDNDAARREIKPLSDILNECIIENFSTDVRAFDKEIILKYKGLSISFYIDVIVDEDLKTVTFYPENGEKEFTREVVIGKVLEEPAAPIKAGLKLQDWIDDNGKIYSFASAVQASFNLHARYFAEYAFYNGDRNVKTLRVTEGQIANGADIPTLAPKAGYTAAWRHNNTGKPLAALNPIEMEKLQLAAEIYGVPAAVSVRFDAVYIPDTYRVKVDIAGGQMTDGGFFEDENGVKNIVSVPNGFTIQAGMALFGQNSNVLLKENVTKGGDFGNYTFAGWYIKDGDNFVQAVDITSTPINGDLTITARWQYAVTFAYAVVTKDPVYGKISINNNYDLLGTDKTRYSTVWVDEGKAVSAEQIPVRAESEYYGFDRWWYRNGNTGPGNNPDKITDRENEATQAVITSKVGTPKDNLRYFETFYQISYTVTFDIGDGKQTTGGVSLTVTGKKFGDKLIPNEVPTSTDISYDKGGKLLNFYGWFLDETKNTAFDSNVQSINEVYGHVSFENGVAVGSMTIYADYNADINWVDKDPIGAESGRVAAADARLSRNSMTRAALPKLKTNLAYDRDWYLDEKGAAAAFDPSTGKIKNLTQGTLYAVSKPKIYTISFVLKNTDGGAVTANVPSATVRANEPLRILAAYSHWDGTMQIAGLRDASGLWEIEGYYKDEIFSERYRCVTSVVDGETVTVTEDTFSRATTVYVRFVRVATEGLIFFNYSDAGTYVQRTQSLSGFDIIVIPETYRGLPVIGIDIGAFEDFAATHIYTPSTVREIRNNAFYNCVNLATLLTMAKDCKLGEKVFHNTAWYTGEWQKASVANVRYITVNQRLLYEYKDGAAYETFTIPEGIEVIGTKAFDKDVVKLTGAVLPMSLRIIREKAFYMLEGTGATGFHTVTTAVKNAEGTTQREYSALELVEAGAFYRLPQLKTLDVFSTKYRTFDNVLYAMENETKNSLVAYPTLRAAQSYLTKDGGTHTYYIIDESVASIQEDAFSRSSLDVLVFRRGTNSAITATSLPGGFGEQFGADTIFYVPYTLDSSGDAIVQSFYAEWINTIGSVEVLPDAFRVSFRSPQAAKFFPSEQEWESRRYFSFADTLVGFEPEIAEGLRINGLYGSYTNGVFSSRFADGAKIFFDVDVYEEWYADMSFVMRGTTIAMISAPLGSTLSDEQLATIAIKPERGKNSEWSGMFGDPTEELPLLFGDMRGVKVRYGGVYSVLDTQIVYHVFLRDPYDTAKQYPDFTVPYGMSVSTEDEYFPLAEGRKFVGWFFGGADSYEFKRQVNFGDSSNVSIFNETLVEGYSGIPLENKEIPVYLYARWYVTVSFFETKVSADGAITVPKQATYEIDTDFGGDLNGFSSSPPPYEGFVASWASYNSTTGTMTDVSPSAFLKVKENFSVYANYRRKLVNVTFRAEGSPDTVLNDVGYGAGVPKEKIPKDPIKSGYLFDDWYYDNTTFTDRFDPTKPVTSDVVVYARFVAIPLDANLFDPANPDAPNGAGLIFEKIDGSAVTGNFEFRLKSARKFSGKVLYLPTDIYSYEGGTKTKIGLLTQIQAGAFDGNNTLEHILIGGSVRDIAEGAFRNIPNLRKITVSSSNGILKSIDGALYSSINSKSILVKYPSAKEGTSFTLPDGYSIGAYAFETPRNLNSIVITGARPIVAEGAFSGIDWAKFNVFVPTSELNYYRNDKNWLREIGAAYIEKVFRGSTVIVTFQNTLTGAAHKTESDIPLNGTVADPGAIADPAGYTFGGWCTDKEGVNKYVFGQPITGAMTLYARFVRNRTTGLHYSEVAKVGGGIAGYEVSYGTATDKNVVIPNFYNGYPVIKISENGFMDANIVSLELPYTISSIGDGAFFGLTNLANISLGNLGGKITSKYYAVANNILYNAARTALLLYPAAASAPATLTVANTVTEIGDYAFYANRYLREITLPSSVTRIGFNAFNRAAALKKLLTNSTSTGLITLADANAFSATASDFRIFVTRALLPLYQANGTSWTNVKDKIFAYTATVSYYYNFGDADSISTVEKETFQYVSEPRYAEDSELNVIVTSPPVGKTFKNWRINSVGADTGKDWDYNINILTRDIKLYAVWADATDENMFVDNNQSSTKYAVLSLSTNADRSVSTLTIPSVFNGKPVTEIAVGGFADLKNLSAVVLPASLVSIQKNAFSGCSKLLSVTFPESCQSIAESAFENCSLLQSVRLPSNLSVLSKAVFKNTGISSFDFGKSSITTIGDEAFFNCTYLRSITLPESLLTIGASAFENAIGVTSLTIPAKVKTIGKRAFFKMSKLQDLFFAGDAVTEIGEAAFQECTVLSSVRLPNRLDTIASELFYGATSLRSIEIPDSVVFINDGAFRMCQSLISVKFGSRIQKIGANAFAGTAISTVNLPSAVDQFGDNAFAGISGLSKIYLKSTPSTFGLTVFGTGILKLKIFAENEAVYQAYKGLVNFSIYTSVFMKRYVTVTFEYIGASGQTLTAQKNAESDLTLAEPEISGLVGYGYPSGGENYQYKTGFWKYTQTVDGITTSSAWNFKTDLVRKDMILTMQYIITPENSGETSEGLIYRLVSGDAWEVVSVGALANKSTLVIPNYYQRKPVVSIAAGFLNSLKAVGVHIVIPDTVKKIEEDAFRSSSIASFAVANNDTNPNFRVDNGGLYQILSARTSKLLRYPSLLTGNRGNYLVSSPTFTLNGATTTLTAIGAYAFEYNSFSEYTVAAGLAFHVADGVLYEAASAPSEVMISYPNLKSLAGTAGDGTFTILSNVRSIYKTALSFTLKSEVKKFAVDTGNQNYFADDYGVLYRVDSYTSSDKRCTLVRMPAHFESEGKTYIVKSGLTFNGAAITLTAIGEGAFENVSLLQTIVFSLTEGENVPSLASTNAFTNCTAYLLVDNGQYDEFKKKANWADTVLYKRYSYITYNTLGVVPQDLSDKFIPKEFSGVKEGYIKQVQTISRLQSLEDIIDAKMKGLLRVPYSEIEGWYYDAAMTSKVNFDQLGEAALVTGDITIYAKMEVESKASKPPVAIEGELQKQYFSFVEVWNNGVVESYEVILLTSGNIRELSVLVIPSYYSPDGTEKNRLPVTGFYDDGTDNTKYNGFVNLTTLVLPETFRNMRNIFRVTGTGVSQPKNLKRLVILSREKDYLRPEHVLKITEAELRNFVAVANSDLSYCFLDYVTYSAYRQNTVWSTSAAIRGKLMSTVLDIRIENPQTGELVNNAYLSLESGVETLMAYNYPYYESLARGRFDGYEFVGFEMYSVTIGEGGEVLTRIGAVDKDTTKFGGVIQPSPNPLNDRIVLKALYRVAPPLPPT